MGVWVQRVFVWYPFGVNPLTGKESMVGGLAEIRMVKPNYVEVKYDSQLWKARVINGGQISIGDQVVIKDVISNTLVVEPAKKKKSGK